MSSSSELPISNDQKLQDLDEALDKFRSQKRWSDIVRTLLAKVDLLGDSQEKINVLFEAGNL